MRDGGQERMQKALVSVGEDLEMANVMVASVVVALVLVVIARKAPSRKRHLAAIFSGASEGMGGARCMLPS